MGNKKSKAFGIAVAMAVTMLSLAVIVVTFAWLYDKTQSIKNTWTVGKVYITLTETPPELLLVPAETDTKDPTIIVESKSEDCYVFVKIVEDLGSLAGKGTFDEFIEYDVAAGWTPLDETNHPGIYYRKHTQADTDQSYPVLKDNQIYYPQSVTSDMVRPAWADGAVLPTLTFTGYAIQASGITDAADAWNKLVLAYTETPATP